MRVKDVSETVLQLLKNNKTSEAIKLFNEECDVQISCKYMGNPEKCTNLCLLSKLQFMHLSKVDINLGVIIHEIKKII